MTDIRDLLRNMPTRHYYGDLARILFICGGLIMLTTLPILGNIVPVPYFVSIILILVLSVLAGVTNPVQKWINLVNVFVSVVAFVVFEYYSVDAYTHTKGFFFFFVNQVLAIIFFVALYYCTKTLRGKLQNTNKEAN